MTLTSASWHRLKGDPDFQDFMLVLVEARQAEVDRLIGGSTLRGGAMSAELTAKAVGTIRGLDIALAYKPEDTKE